MPQQNGEIMTKLVKFIGDHSGLHCGCQAVVQVFHEEIAKIGQITEGEEYDILIVNGEGSMHHNSGDFRMKAEAIRAGIDQGAKVYLLNTVWQMNDRRLDDILPRLTAVTVRDVSSRDDMIRRHNFTPKIFPDISLQAKIEPMQGIRDLEWRTAITDFYSKDFGGFVKVTDGAGWQEDNIYVDMKTLRWSEFVGTLSTASMLITGRQHAVMAACKARTPFVALEGNTHKISGFLRLSGINIPVCTSPSEIDSVSAWVAKNNVAFQDLFDWVEELPVWSLESGLGC